MEAGIQTGEFLRAGFDGKLAVRTACTDGDTAWCRCKSLPQRLQSIGVKTGEVERKFVEDEIRTTGNVAVDETRLAYVQVRFSGYIQKVFADATYQYVRKGQPLFTIYSPDLVATEREYLVAKQNQQASGAEHSAGRRFQRSLACSTQPRSGSSSGASRKEKSPGWNRPAKCSRNWKLILPFPATSPSAKLCPTYASSRKRASTPLPISRPFGFQRKSFRTTWDESRLAIPPRSPWTPIRAGRFAAAWISSIPKLTWTRGRPRYALVFPNPDLQLKPGMFVNVDLKVPMGRPTRDSRDWRSAVRH